MSKAHATALSVAAAMAFTLASSAAQADGKSEIVNAQTHAELAAKAADLATVHMHLHHTVNCLVGPGGAGFDAKELNPCAQAGKGAIPDAASATKKTALQTAVAKAQAGIASADLKTAQEDAMATAAMLQKD